MLRKFITRALFIIGLLSISTLANADNNPKFTAYITCDNSIAVFDSSNDTLIGNIGFPKTPLRKIDVSFDGKIAYALLVGERTDSPIAIINTVTHQIAGMVNNLPNNENTYRFSMAVSPDGKYAYVGESGGYGHESLEQIEIIDASTNLFIGTIQGYPTNFRAWRIAFTPDSQKALVIDNHNVFGSDEKPSLLFINTKTQTVTNILSTPKHYPSRLTITPDSKKAYLTSSREDNGHGWQVMVIDVTSETVKKYIDLPNYINNGPVSIAITPDNKKAYVLQGATYDGESLISIIDTNTDTVSGTIQLTFPRVSDPSKITISPDGKKAYVIYEDDHKHLTIIDVATDKVINTINDRALKEASDMVFFKIESSK